MSTHAKHNDTAAAFTGLIVGLLGLAVVVLATVYLTNKKFESHEQPTATAPR